MSKGRTIYACTECGAQANKWAGQCGDCGAWNCLQEAPAMPPTAKSGIKPAGYAGATVGSEVRTLAEVDVTAEIRQSCGNGELDRVLGGGLVQGSVTLIGGDPGIGKSTLLLQALAELAARNRTLYVSGEESPQQISMRAQRLSLSRDCLRLLPEINVERILAIAEAEQPQVMVIDSIQTVFTERLQSAPGSVAQVRESAAQLVRYAKASGTALFLVGHVTKEGAIAGPRVLEHMVDTVLYFEGDPSGHLRVLRAVKNRYGPVNELGVFAMTERGLKEVSNPSAIFLSRHDTPVAGSVIMVTREGTRPLLVEIQALVDECHGSNPRRVTLGLEQNRLAMLLAVLHRHGGIAMYDQDVYVNAVGGVRINETAADLAVLLAALSSFRDRPLPIDLVVFGEVGLAGEIRPVPNGEDRLREAAKHGFKQAIVPRANLPRRGSRVEGLELRGVTRLAEVMGNV
ncbi:MAG: DNA repair protein RadA [Candidatus Competibacteraceae bacterium]|uniref:DNA repair protein RadA n=1 Tax=Candidatus Contendobacter odensis Run_B_J11 TaxID=1400861 RepID=A0A7U7GDJ8_9GAMM|nr:DNA repair protein RadA [Candidatus Contendobacter odensis]MBK8535319.1 DNA repair protein RadA [Candidatus Competibacteraceae bacterium]MBK8753882.1 DNA repair protein RadA [Candidatus Competibacteraceae bacterium]CDH46435.1 DNA repair protein [Candidatus Contendobacter odensis Run_B_J11]